MKPAESPADEVPVAAEILERYVGAYDYGTAILNVRFDGQHLRAQLTGQQEFEIFPKSETEFFWKAVNAQLTFMRDDSGRVTHAVHRQNGRTFDAPRMADRQAIALDPQLLDAYVGKYNYGARIFVLTVTKENDRLFAQLTGQPKLEILPKAVDQFYWKDVNADVEFVKNDEGKVIKAIHRQGGRTIEAPKFR
jgi:hypothetical protein